ncbi:MAG: YhbY family RNA-binding protein [Proteobacteria bacterium]|nr:YhbY family RNA-binding protein [Pseudomonadota bacterium]MCL2306898.1 YhbY family RNA-binding protein [Pseudomonadota bacterium]
MLTLTPTERRALRAQAHTLTPVVMIGQHGLTPAVLREIDNALNTHELIKVRIFNDDRAEREALQLAVCHQLACAPVQHLGKLIVLWRPAPPKKEAAPKPAKRPAKKAASKTAKKAALPGAISRHGQAIKPLSARQAREQAQQPEWQPARQPRPSGRKTFSNAHSDRPSDEAPTNRRRSPQPAGRGSRGSLATGGSFGAHKTGGKSPFPQEKPSARQPRPSGRKTFSDAHSDRPSDEAPTNRRRSPQPAGRGSRGSLATGSSFGAPKAGGKPPFSQTKSLTKPSARQPRGASGVSHSASRQPTGRQSTARQPTSQPSTRPPSTHRRRLGGRGKT